MLNINDKFYQSFGAAFAETRRRLQPGVQRVIQNWIQDGDWLDLGCGSGVLGQTLAQSGLRGSYLGLDFSDSLLAEARKGAAQLSGVVDFRLDYGRANLLDARWEKEIHANRYDGVLCFAALHHIPGRENRQRIFSQAYPLLKPGGVFIHSEWQFHRNPKLLARVQPWSKAGLSEGDLEEGDTLLDWRHFSAEQTAEPGLRYVHLFSAEELADLAKQSGFSLLEEFDSDGVSGNLGWYQVLQKPQD